MLKVLLPLPLLSIFASAGRGVTIRVPADQPTIHAGIAAALAGVFPYVPTQISTEHKIRAVAAHLRGKRRRKAFLAKARAIYDADDVPQARRRLDAFSRRWSDEV